LRSCAQTACQRSATGNTERGFRSDSPGRRWLNAMGAAVVDHIGKNGLRAAGITEPTLRSHDELVLASAASITQLDWAVRNRCGWDSGRYRTNVQNVETCACDIV